ncbi:MAG TPA: hypothetical protein VHG93_13550 [Longimicrobium sp.]|nr:hypothetical protein [Longimicrobium sp.]
MMDPDDAPWTAADDAIEEVREIRRRISARFDNDPGKLADHYMELQKRHADRLVYPPVRGQSAAMRNAHPPGS